MTMSVLAGQIREQATELLNRLPTPNISRDTAKVYEATWRRMMAEETVDPLRAGDARDTYNVRRAALHACTRSHLISELYALEQASRRGDRERSEWALRVLARIVERCGPAIDRDPPKTMQNADWSEDPSRWTTAKIPHPQRGKASKKHLLRDFPADWMNMVWAATAPDWKYRDVLAVHMLTPVRPAEFIPAMRDGRWVPGIVVALSGNVLTIGVAPVKTHGGKFGTDGTAIRLCADAAHPAVQHLVQRCRAARGRTIVVALDGTNGVRKALEKLGRRALGDGTPKLTGYVFRHQAIADYKKTFGAGALVAAAAGHCTDRTQSHYGRVEHGRRRTELIGVRAKRTPRVGNIGRARLLPDEPEAIVRP
jgi:LPS sulfotransferase NodH